MSVAARWHVAFAIYDARQRELFLARDRLGAKPLFMAPLSDGSMAFASELKGLLAHPLLKRQLDLRAIEDYMTWGLRARSPFDPARVEKMPAGHFRVLRHGQPSEAPRRYWDIDFTQRSNGSIADHSVELLYYLREGVQSRMTPTCRSARFCRAGWIRQRRRSDG